jgi:hypothetical protein
MHAEKKKQLRILSIKKNINSYTMTNNEVLITIG